MATGVDIRQKAELDRWLVKLNPAIAQQLREAGAWWEAEEKKDPTNKQLKKEAGKNQDALLAMAKDEARREALAKGEEHAKETKKQHEEAKAARQLLDWERKAGKSQKALEVLMNGLQQLGDDDYLKSSNAYQDLKPSGEPFIDKLLGQVDDVFKLWKTTDQVPEALALWQKAEPIIQAILKEGEKHFESSGFGLCRGAMFRIGKRLGMRLAYKEESDAADSAKTTDVGEALDLVELKKMEPAMLEWQELINKQAGRLSVHGGKVKKLTQALEIYFSVHDLSEKLKAFQAAELGVKIKTVADIVAYIGDETLEVAKVYAEAAQELALKLGKKEAAEALEKRLASFEKVAGVLAIYELGKSIGELVKAIDKGDWHEIASASFGVASSGIGVAEAFGVIGGGTAAAATGAAFLIWAEADAIIGVAELVHWAKLDRALRAVKKMAADTKTIADIGKRMTVATELMLKSNNGSTDVVESAKYAVHEQQAIKLAGSVSKGIKILGNNHVFRKDLDSVGGYAELVDALGKPARDALMGAYLEDPISVSDRFQTVLLGIKAMVTKGSSLYGSAD